VDWFGGTHLLYTRSLCSVWLAESLVRSGDREPGRTLAAAVLATSEAVGYRHLQGVAHRVLGESLMPDDRDAAMLHLQQARLILEETGANNELAKTLVTEAAGHAALGNAEEARLLLEEGERLFEALGTVGEPERLHAALHSRRGGADT
jgi:hypothetical protein